MTRYRQWHDAYARLCRAEADAVAHDDETPHRLGYGLTDSERSERAAWLLAEAKRAANAWRVRP